MHSIRVAPPLLFAVALVLIAGCSTHRTTAPLATTHTTWIGTYSAGTGPQRFVLDVDVTGPSVAGRIAMNPDEAALLYVVGSLVGDSLDLSLDPAHMGSAGGFAITGRVAPGGSLTARCTRGGVSGTMNGRVLPRVSLVVERSLVLPISSGSLASDGTHLWFAALDGYVRTTTAGTVIDTVTILDRPGMNWVSTAIAWDGGKWWGQLPGTIMAGDTHVDYSDLKAFTTAGRTGDSLRVWHRVAGLAWDGAALWSLRAAMPRVYRLAPTGALADSFDLEMPDPAGFAFGSGRFWTRGWNLDGLYVIDAEGHALAVAEPPYTAGDPRWPVGVAVNGADIWIASVGIGYTRVYLTHLAGTLPS